tara:strand:- start:906 stop:1016 length:111 start_codon:yes stop_codon:yes gene_type:complete
MEVKETDEEVINDVSENFAKKSLITSSIDEDYKEDD